MRKYVFFAIGFLLFLTLLIVSLKLEKPELETLNVESLAMHEEYLVMNVGETQVLIASIYPFNANNQTVIWQSSNEDVATVEEGIITAHNVGNVQITATSEEGGYSDYCYLDVIYG